MSSGNSILSGASSPAAAAASSASAPILLSEHLLATQSGDIFLIGCSSEDLYWPSDTEGSHAVKRFETLHTAEESLKSVESAGENEQTAVLSVNDLGEALSQQIGQAVRAFPNRLIVYTCDQAAPDTLFFSFGFRKLDVAQGVSSGLENRWYEYRLSHYKQSPDWLNARFWANPERFNLDDDLDIYFDPDDTDEEE